MTRAWRGTVPLLLGVLVLFACLFGLVSPAGAALIEPLSLEQMSDRAQTIVYARTVETTSRYATDASTGDGKGIIETVVKLQVLDTLKGETQKEMTLVVPGGTVGDLTFRLDSAPTFTGGDTDLLFLDDEGEVIHGSVGVLEVEQGLVVSLDKSLNEVRQAIEGDEVDLGALADLRPAAEDSGFTKQVTSMQLSEPLTGRAQSPSSGSANLLTAALNEGFESNMNRWTLFGSPTWGRTNLFGYKDGDWQFNEGSGYTGGYSAFCDGSPSNGYSNNMDARMTAGPFDLSGVTAGSLDFQFIVDTEEGYDYCSYLVSLDGTNFYGYGLTGFGRDRESLDLSAIPTGSGTISAIGDSSVWIMFRFYSDGDINYDEEGYYYLGAFIDDVQLAAAVPGPAPVINSISPSSASAGTGTVVSITGSNFGAVQGGSRVEFYYNGESRIPAPIVSWSNTLIRCKVPTGIIDGYSASAGSGPVRVLNSEGQVSNGYDFNVTFGYGGTRFGGTSVTYVLNPNTEDTSSEEALFDAGAATWNPASAFKFVDGGATTVTNWQNDGANAIFWTTSLSDGVLAAAGTWSQGSTGMIIDADIGFNDNYTWGNGTGGTVDIQSVATHELGHWLRLLDLYGPGDSQEVMYGIGGSGQKRSLHADDIAGAVWIYGAASLPTITSLSAKQGPSRGGTSVVINGTNFTGATKVTFGGTAAKSFAVNSATKITAVSPAHLPGTVQVQVTTPQGTSANVAADDYRYLEPFTDLNSTKPYYKQIIELYNRGVIDGAAGKFNAGNPVIRQQFTKMILNTLVIPHGSATYSFKDVPLSQRDATGYPYHFIAQCVKQGIIQGYKLDKAGVLFGKRLAAGSYFFPANNMTRAQLITMVVRAAEKRGKLTRPVGTVPWKNFDAAHYENTRKAQANGLLTGLSGLGAGYNFNAQATRGEVCVVLYNYLQLK